MPGKDTNIGAKRARETRALLGIEPEAPVGCLLTVVEQRLGLPVVLMQMRDDVAGACWRDGDRTLLWVNAGQAVVRQRFTLAHEVGHVRCGHRHDIPVETIETLAGRSTDAREIQANAFAAEFLAPMDGVRAMVRGEPDLDDVVRIAARYGISTIAALFRLNNLAQSNLINVLRAAVERGEDGAAWERLAPEVVHDELAAIEPPRLSPVIADSALGLLLGVRPADE